MKKSKKFLTLAFCLSVVLMTTLFYFNVSANDLLLTINNYDNYTEKIYYDDVNENYYINIETNQNDHYEIQIDDEPAMYFEVIYQDISGTISIENVTRNQMLIDYTILDSWNMTINIDINNLIYEYDIRNLIAIRIWSTALYITEGDYTNEYLMKQIFILNHNFIYGNGNTPNQGIKLEDITATTWIKQVFNGIGDIFTTHITDNITIGEVVLIPVALNLLIVFIKLWKKE